MVDIDYPGQHTVYLTYLTIVMCMLFVDWKWKNGEKKKYPPPQKEQEVKKKESKYKQKYLTVVNYIDQTNLWRWRQLVSQCSD